MGQRSQVGGRDKMLTALVSLNTTASGITSDDPYCKKLVFCVVSLWGRKLSCEWLFVFYFKLVPTGPFIFFVLFEKLLSA